MTLVGVFSSRFYDFCFVFLYFSRKVYLSGASSDSESYGSPSSEEEDRSGRGRNRTIPKTADQLARTKPALFESKRPAVLIGGLTLVAFCDPKKRRRRFRDRPHRRQRTSRSASRSSTSDVIFYATIALFWFGGRGCWGLTISFQ